MLKSIAKGRSHQSNNTNDDDDDDDDDDDGGGDCPLIRLLQALLVLLRELWKRQPNIQWSEKRWENPYARYVVNFLRILSETIGYEIHPKKCPS